MPSRWVYLPAMGDPLGVLAGVINSVHLASRQCRINAHMSLTPGSHVDRYEILELIGLGEVYRAKDTKLLRGRLDGDLTRQLGILCSIDLSHAALTKEFEDLVAVQMAAGREIHIDIRATLAWTSCFPSARPAGRRAPLDERGVPCDQSCHWPDTRTETAGKNLVIACPATAAS